MKSTLLRLIEATHTGRRQPLPAAARQPVPDTRLPHRALALRALRQLARGHVLVLGGESALGVSLAGVPDIVHLARDLIQRGLVERVDVPECGAACYVLSNAGRDTLHRGEQWWREISLFDRLIVEFTG